MNSYNFLHLKKRFLKIACCYELISSLCECENEISNQTKNSFKYSKFWCDFLRLSDVRVLHPPPPKKKSKFSIQLSVGFECGTSPFETENITSALLILDYTNIYHLYNDSLHWSFFPYRVGRKIV